MIEDQDKQVRCLNCETEFNAHFDFCPHCGQKNKPLDLQFKYFVYEFLDGSFNIDSKFWRTFKLLLFYPGKLTKEFLAGKRASYIQPVRIYLIASLVYFTLLSFIQTDIVDLRITNDNSVSADSSLTILESGGIVHQRKIPGDTTIENQSMENGEKDGILTFNNFGQSEDLVDTENDTAKEESEMDMEQSIGKKIQKLETEEGKKTFFNTFQKYLSLGMFVLMPVTALLFFLLFRQKTFYVQHLVFVLHLQSVMFILFSLFILVAFVSKSIWFDLTRALMFLAVLILWLKKFYETRWIVAFMKSFLFLFLYGIVFLLFLGIVGTLSAWNL